MNPESQPPRYPQLKHYENPMPPTFPLPLQATEQKREYGCPCGKTYLSYPALFTHVKQKHDGKAPGKLIKPKTDKARGRPKIHIETPQDDMSDGILNLEEEIEAALHDVRLPPGQYNEPMQMSEGSRTCQDMATTFIRRLPNNDDERTRILNCFFNELKECVDIKYGEETWTSNKPNQIGDAANFMALTHGQRAERYPLPGAVITALLYVLFRWMYNNKWTDHKLIRRSTSIVVSNMNKTMM